MKARFAGSAQTRDDATNDLMRFLRCSRHATLLQEAAGGEVTKEEKFADVGAREEYADEPQK